VGFIDACAGANGSVSGGSAPARSPEVAPVGAENMRVAAFVIMRSGGAREGSVGGDAWSGRAWGAEPKGETRENQPGPVEAFDAGRPANWITNITKATMAASAPAAWRRLSSSTLEG